MVTERTAKTTRKKYYLTTPIYYVNAEPHIGHVYTTVAADTMARWRRFCGEEVFFLTGTDEHGSKIDAAAREAGISPQELADRMSDKFRTLWETLGIKYDRFIKTTETGHQRVVQSLFHQLYRKGDIYPGIYRGNYCLACENYLTPSDGATCPQCRREAKPLEEKTYFFRLSRYQEKLKQHLAQNPEFIQPEQRREEVLNMLGPALPDLSLTRQCHWGVPLPEGVPEKETLTIYVWFDALLNYLSGVDYPGKKPGAGGAGADRFLRFWPPDLQFVGKDIIRFHHVIWPALLMSAELPLPGKIFAHGWWLSGGEKMSKSRGNVVEPFAFCQEYGPEALRYFLLAEVPFGNDGNFNEAAFRKRYNSDLANDLGNLVHRFLHLIQTNHGGQVPAPEGPIPKVAEQTLALLPELRRKMDAVDFYGFLEDTRAVISLANHYLDEKAPWRKQPDAAGVLYAVAEVTRIITLYLEPVLPGTAAVIRERLGATKQPQNTDGVQWGLLKPGTRIKPGPPLFPRIKDT